MHLFKVHLFDSSLISFHQHFLPSDMNGIFAREFIKDSVTANHDKVMIILDFEGCNVRISDHHIGITFVLFLLSLDISNGPGDGEAAREHSMGTIYYLFTGFTQGWVRLDYLRVLVNSATILDDSFHFNLVGWLMIS